MSVGVSAGLSEDVSTGTRVSTGVGAGVGVVTGVGESVLHHDPHLGADRAIVVDGPVAAAAREPRALGVVTADKLNPVCVYVCV